MAYWLIIERVDNWLVDRAAGFNSFGLSERHRKASDQVRAGDLICSYVSSGVSAFADVREATADGAKPLCRAVEYDAGFSLALSTKPIVVLERSKWIPISDVLDELELTKGKKEWRQLFRTALRALSHHDGELIHRIIKHRHA